MVSNPYGRVALITGASSGIGQCTAQMLARSGFAVYGGSRRGGGLTDYGEGYIQMIALNVDDDGSVEAAVRHVVEREGRIDVLINAAGTGICGAVEDCLGSDAMRQMNTNYVGVVRMIRCVLPIMREQGKGLIVNIGSVGGIFSIPFQTLYSSSKFAVEALTEGLRIECRPFGVRAALIEPGDVKTSFTANRMYAGGCSETAYGEAFLNSIAQMESDEKSGKGPETIARAVMKLIQRKNPPVRRVVGAKYKAFVFLKRLLPARAVEALMTMMYPLSNIRDKDRARVVNG